MSAPPAGFVIDEPEVGQSQDASALPPGFIMDKPEVVAATQQPEQGWVSKAAQMWDKIRGVSVGQLAGGAVETGLALGTGAAGALAGGYAGLATAINPYGQHYASSTPYGGYTGQGAQPPPQKTTAEPREVVEGVAGAMTYEPRGKVGQAAMSGIESVLGKYENFSYEKASQLGDPEDVLGATAAYTALMYLPAIVGLKSVRRVRGGAKPKPNKGKAPSRGDLKREAQDLYRRADEAEAMVPAEQYSSVLSAIERRLAEEGFDRGLHPDTWSALQNLKSKEGLPHSLKGTEVNRKVINGARGAIKSEDARMANIMMDVYDDWLLAPGTVIGKDAAAVSLAPEARALWRRKMKSDEIQWAIERAEIRADANYSGAALETALKQEFAAILKNKKRRKMFNENELAIIRAVVKGTKGQQLLRLIGKFAPRGVISAAPLGFLATSNPPLALAGLVMAEGAKRSATALTKRNALKADETVRRGPQ